MTQGPSNFDHLDHVTNSLIEAGVIAKTSGQVYDFGLPGGGHIRWSIDMIREALAKLPESVLNKLVHPMPLADVRHYVAANPVTIGYVDQGYARCMDAAHLARPLYAIDIPPDIGAAPESVGSRIIIDGNHRLVYAHRNNLPCRYYLLPPEIEKACRIPIE